MEGKKTAFGVLSIRQEHIYLFSLLSDEKDNFIDPILSYQNLRPLYRLVVNRGHHEANNVTCVQAIAFRYFRTDALQIHSVGMIVINHQRLLCF